MDDDNNLLLIAVFTTLTIFSWVFFELVKTTKTSTVSSTVQLLSAPLSSKIDIDIISDLETKQTFD
ncbi:MAG: hypothetical protein AAB492_01665 [Patescibacteria group bacterium]